MAAQPCPRLYGGVWHFSRCAACRHVTITHPPLAAAGAGRGRVLLPPKQWAVRHYHSVLVSGAAEGAPDCKERTGPSPHQRWPLKPLGGSLAYLHTSPWRCSPDKKALIEKAVDTLKEKKEATAASVSSLQEQKSSLAVRVKEVILQYYHGFRLLALDSRVAFRLLRKTVQGNNLTRRELKLFRRTVADLFRIVPFSVFIIIPFMEFLLPVYLYLFPNALPSTFQSSSSKAARKKNELKVKLQMAKFLQDTVEEMAVTGKKNKREAVREFAEFFEKIRVSGDQASTEDIIRFSKLFEDELTLDNLTTPTLKALCRLLLLQPIGSSNFLRFQLRMKLRQLMADDDMIQREGVDSLNVAELQAASQARGMRALGIPEERLRSQLAQWLDLHLSQQVPSSLLLLSRALYLPEEVDALQATLSTLPQPIVEEVEVRVADSSGETVDNKTRLDVIRQQEELIREEAREKEKAKEEMEAAAVAEASRLASEQMEDKAPIISSSSPPVAVSPSPSPSPLPQPDALESITVEEIRNLSEVVTTLKGDRLLEDEIQELKDEREEHREDVAELAEECAKVHEELSESKGSALLGKKVDVMISKLDETLRALEKGYVVEEGGEGALQEMQKDKCDEITCTELEAALVALKQTSGEAKVRSLVSQLDPDHDGNINLQEVAVVIESLAHEDTDIKPEHIALIKELIEREGHHGNKEQKNAIS